MNKYLAEAIGTFALVFTGCGAIVVNDLYGGVLGHVGISLAFGLTIMIMIYAVGNVSGAHFNPAVTLGFFFAKRLEAREIPPYVTGEFAGAFSAALLLKILFPVHKTLGTTVASGSIIQSLVVEIVLTFLLMFVILNVSTGYKEKGIMAGVAIGGMVALGALFGGPVSGASMNPARSLAPGLISGVLDGWWIYIVGPVLGAYFASPTCRLIQGAERCESLPEEGF